MAEKKDSNRVPEAELILPRGKKVILQAEDTDYKRGLIVELLDNGGYEMAYWYDKPDKPYPVEILVDGVSIKPDGKVVEMKFHPQDYYDEQDKLNEIDRYSGFSRNQEDPDSEKFEPTGSVAQFREELRALFGKFKGDLRNPEFIRGVAEIMVNWKSLLRSQLDEAKKKSKSKKKDPPIGKPKRGGSKAYYVYVRDPKTKRIKKVSFGSGGLRAKIRNPKARKAFAARHKCAQKNDRTKASYWSCRLPRYAKQLGLGSNMNTFW